MRSLPGRVARAMLDLVAPPRCLACRAVATCTRGLCPSCVGNLPVAHPSPCRRCAAPLGEGLLSSRCRECRRMRPRFAAAVAGAPYSGLAAELVRRTKYGRDPLLALPLATLTRRAAGSLPERAWADDVVPVPASARRRRERGFDLAELLADDLARALELPLRRRWLIRVGDPPPQAALGETERRRAARATVAYHGESTSWRSRWRLGGGRGVDGRRVLLVDDVLTTGATANACTAALESGGAAWVAVVVAARA